MIMIYFAWICMSTIGLVSSFVVIFEMYTSQAWSKLQVKRKNPFQKAYFCTHVLFCFSMSSSFFYSAEVQGFCCLQNGWGFRCRLARIGLGFVLHPDPGVSSQGVLGVVDGEICGGHQEHGGGPSTKQTRQFVVENNCCRLEGYMMLYCIETWIGC